MQIRDVSATRLSSVAWARTRVLAIAIVGWVVAPTGYGLAASKLITAAGPSAVRTARAMGAGGPAAT